MAHRTGPVVVGVDGSDQSLAAMRVALGQAELRDLPLHVVHCADVTPAILHLAGGVTVNTAELAARAHEAVWEAVAPLIEVASVDVEQVSLTGYPGDELAQYCSDTDAVLLVVGRRGRGRMASAVLGSTSLRALEHAPCDVLIAKTPLE